MRNSLHEIKVLKVNIIQTEPRKGIETSMGTVYQYPGTSGYFRILLPLSS